MIRGTTAAGLALACLGLAGSAAVAASGSAGGAVLAAGDVRGTPAAAVHAPVSRADVARMQQSIERLVSQGHFMGSVLVAQGVRVLLDRGYGSADLELDVPDTPRTKFLLGSVTKQFTVAAILLLQQRGRLKISDPIKDYLIDAPPAWDSITIFDLLTHTSGIPSYSNLPDFDSTKALPASPQQLLDRFRDQPLQFAPGTAWRYSNSGYALLGYLIERISGQSYAQFIQRNIFDPLGMKDSGYGSNAAIIPRRARGYTPGPDGAPVNADYIDMSVPYAAGGLYSTTADLLRWEQGLYGGKLLSAASLQQMTTPFMNDYALGLMVRRTPDGQKIFTHGGAIYGFNCDVSYAQAQKLSVIVLANLNGPAAQLIGASLMQIALHQQLPASPGAPLPAFAPSAQSTQPPEPPEPLSD
ncbi:MAG TPA: serine hydrolase domain-containing protein [Steroidobacteraceae bacterium]|jgi:CubicO group peptidase (beta-lactamase class C family)|nr:serine hydrolase domain-containing protein [Steroidobacteraceae bacterium]